MLGAGNCNDLELADLLRAHGEVHLVDLDGDALAWGAAQQGFGDDARVRLHGGIDVTGMLDDMAAWSPTTPIVAADLDALKQRPIREVSRQLPGPFDVVISSCLLSQLIASVAGAVGERHARFQELFQAIRAGHLGLLTELIAPGGAGVLITDVVSSATFPALGAVADAELTAVLARLVEQRNFFHGVNPGILLSLMRTDPSLSARVYDAQLTRAWHWRLEPRHYAVIALRFQLTSSS